MMPMSFPTLNLQAGYHHIHLDDDSIPKTAFTLPFGKYENLEAHIRLAQVPVYFQKLMNKDLKYVPFAISYLNDIIYRKTAAEHLDHLQQVFHRLHNAKLSMKLESATSSPKKFNIWAMSSTTGIKPYLKNRSH